MAEQDAPQKPQDESLKAVNTALKEARIEAAQQTVNNLETEQKQRRNQQAENPAALERLNPQIEEAKREREEQAGEVAKYRKELKKAEDNVVEKAKKVRKKASETIMEQAQSLSPNSPKKLAGGTSVGYVSILVANL